MHVGRHAAALAHVHVRGRPITCAVRRVMTVLLLRALLTVL